VNTCRKKPPARKHAAIEGLRGFAFTVDGVSWWLWKPDDQHARELFQRTTTVCISEKGLASRERTAARGAS
jgi:hypothetical protein